MQPSMQPSMHFVKVNANCQGEQQHTLIGMRVGS